MAVSTSEKTHRICITEATGTDDTAVQRSSCIICKLNEPHEYTVGDMPAYWMLQDVVRIITTTLWRVFVDPILLEGFRVCM
jgi:hypothetical protein